MDCLNQAAGCHRGEEVSGGRHGRQVDFLAGGISYTTQTIIFAPHFGLLESFGVATSPMRGACTERRPKMH
jgi:hypothetical protein